MQACLCQVDLPVLQKQSTMLKTWFTVNHDWVVVEKVLSSEKVKDNTISTTSGEGLLATVNPEYQPGMHKTWA